MINVLSMPMISGSSIWEWFLSMFGMADTYKAEHARRETNAAVYAGRAELREWISEECSRLLGYVKDRARKGDRSLESLVAHCVYQDKEAQAQVVAFLKKKGFDAIFSDRNETIIISWGGA